MSASTSSTATVFGALPDAALHRIFQLLCDGCPPTAPGICLLALVCKQWRSLACGVKRLRVVCSRDEQQVDSFCAWVRRHGPQVTALAFTWGDAVPMLAALSEAAAGMHREAAAAHAVPPPPAAAVEVGDGSLPLERLVLTGFPLPYLDPNIRLWPLLGALPRLQHLHLNLTEGMDDLDTNTGDDAATQATAASLGPLQQRTSLTSLVLQGPNFCGVPEVTDTGHELLEQLPTTLRSLTWQLEVGDPRQLAFGHLTGLTHLALTSQQDNVQSSLPDGALSALGQLRQLVLQGHPVSDEVLVRRKEQLVGLGPARMTRVLPQLTRLRALRLDMDLQFGLPVQELLQQAPQLKELCVTLPDGYGPPTAAWDVPWVLRHYPGLTGLQRLCLAVTGTQAAAPGLCALTQLKHLMLSCEVHDMRPMTCLSWVMGLAGLVNLEVLSVPAVLTACWHPWLTGLTRLVVLEVCSTPQNIDTAAAATHMRQLLATGGQHSSSRDGAGFSLQVCQVRVVCFTYSIDYHEKAVKLQRAVAAAVPVLPPNRHLFRGSWQQLQDCGVELWTAPVAARLQQLQLV